ncbi:MAG: phosphotransferase, partial [Planctomycetota bacterium]
LRAVPRWLPAARLAYNFRSFARLALPVPRLLDSDLSPVTRLRWGFYALSEEYVRGQPPTETADRAGAVRAVARALARFHTVERPRWGWPAFPRLGSYRRYVLRRVSGRVGHLAGALPSDQCEALLAWFAQHADLAALEPPFSLTHSRVNSGNFILRPDGEVAVVDLIECRYGTWCPDLVSALHRLCECDERWTAAFLEEYFAARPAWCRAAFEESRTFFEANRALGQAASNTRRAARAADPEAAAALRARLAEDIRRLADLTGVALAETAPGPQQPCNG